MNGSLPIYVISPLEHMLKFFFEVLEIFLFVKSKSEIRTQKFEDQKGWIVAVDYVVR